MLQKLKNWFNKDKIETAAAIARIEEGLNEAREEKAKALAELEATKLQLEETSSALGVFRVQAEADEARRNGKEPWVEIKSAEFNEVKGIQIELDWNEAFVQYLKENGIKARLDEQIVQKWLMMLYADMIEKLEDNIIDQRDTKLPSEFE